MAQTPVVIPPQNVEAEASVLGSILLDGKALLETVADHLTPADFYREINGLVYATMLELYKANEPVDSLTVANKLEEERKLDKIGGASYLAELAGAVPTTANFAAYAEIVERKATLRRLISASRDISELAFKETDEVTTIVDAAEKRLFEVANKFTKTAFASIGDALHESFDRYDLAHQNKGQLHGVPTGFRTLDNKLSGLQKSNLVILAARTSMGKSTLALNIARNAAVRAKASIGLFSLEMSTDQLVDRLVSLEAGIDSWKLRTGNLGDDDFQKIAAAMETLSAAKIHIDDTASVSIMEMRARARRLQVEQGLDLLIVDYLQLMQSGSGRYSDNRVQEISEISRSLKALARELNIPILALSQLSRAVEARPDKRPQLSDLRESGSIEQDADVVMFIYRDEYYEKETEKQNIAEILIKKHRNGPIGSADLYFSADHQKFTDLARQATDSPPSEG